MKLIMAHDTSPDGRTNEQAANAVEWTVSSFRGGVNFLASSIACRNRAHRVGSHAALIARKK
ncbi:hypothetical protein ACQX25_11690, partial [Corynebacterium diphtheriae]